CPRTAAVLRHGDRDRYRGGRQPRRPVDRRPDVAGRRKSGALALGEIRRSGTHGAKWLELHRAWVRDACRSGLLRPWSHRWVPNETRRNKLGEDFFGAGSALVPHG